MESLLTALSALVWLIFGIIALVAGAIVAVFAFAYTWVLISYTKRKDKRSCTELRNSAWLAVGLKIRS